MFQILIKIDKVSVKEGNDSVIKKARNLCRSGYFEIRF